jgi:AraC-like DNA-binding protein
LIISHHTINIFDRKVFERAFVIPPFKNYNPLPEEACFLFVLEGSNNSYSEEEHLTLNEGEGVLMKCGNYIYEGKPNSDTGKCGLLAIHFYPEVLMKIYKNETPVFLKNKSHYKSNMSRVKSNILMSKYIESLMFYFENPNLVSEDLAILKMREIILLLLNTKDSSAILNIMSNLFSTKTFNFKEVIEAHIFSPLSISDLAQLTHKSLASFKREFSKIYQDSPSNYIKNKRLEKAASLLSISNHSITSIAVDCLFNDVAHFSNSFKAKYSLSPSKYRMSQLHK